MVIESDEIRCPACRGIKQVAKLGGIFGDCNTCNGTGKIKECNKPLPCVSEPVINDSDIIAGVSQALPVFVTEPAPIDNAAVEVTKDFVKSGKRAIYKRKRA